MSLTRGRVIQLGESRAPRAFTSRRQARAAGHVAIDQIADAALRAKKILADAQARVTERLLQFERGIETMRADLLKQANADAELALTAKALEIAALRRSSVERARDDIILLAQVLAERVIGEELRLNPERLLKLAQQCIEEARGSSRMVLYAHPSDAAQLSQQIDGLRTDSAIDIRIQAEPGLSPGDLRIETDVGTVNARIGTQLANLAAKIRESFRI